MRSPTDDSSSSPFREESKRLQEEQDKSKQRLRTWNVLVMVAALLFGTFFLKMTVSHLKPFLIVMTLLAAGLNTLLWRLESRGIITITRAASIAPFCHFFPLLFAVVSTGGFNSPMIYSYSGTVTITLSNAVGRRMSLLPAFAAMLIGTVIILLCDLGYIVVPQLEAYVGIERTMIQFITTFFSVFGAYGRCVSLKSTFIEDSLDREAASNDAKSRFVATVSHEMRTPLSTILGWLEILHGMELASDVKPKLNIVKSCAENLLSLINDLLDLSKIESGKLELDSKPFDLSEMASGVFERCKVLFKPQVETALRINLPSAESGNNLIVEGDSHRFSQVLQNLLSNAAKFTNTGRVDVIIEEAQKDDSEKKIQIRFKVQDTGIGISEDAQRRIFKPFVQADSSMSRQYGGSGLGLAISLEIIRQMKGDIAVESKVGSGTTFTGTIWLKLVDHIPKNMGVESRNGSDDDTNRNDVKSTKVLLVEDNKLNQTIIKTILRQKGYNIDTADNGEEAVSKLKASPFDVVLMDFQMPILDGLSATRQIRSLNIHTPVIGLTANGDESSHKEASSVGMCDLLIKPAKGYQITHAIEKALATASPKSKAV